MAFCGPPPPRAALRPAAAHPALPQYTLLQHPLSSKDYASTRTATVAAASHATAAAVSHLRFDIGPHETSVQLSVGMYSLSGRIWRNCTGGSVHGTNQGKNVMLTQSPRWQRLYTHNVDEVSNRCLFAQGITLCQMLYTQGELPEMLSDSTNIAVLGR